LINRANDRMLERTVCGGVIRRNIDGKVK